MKTTIDIADDLVERARLVQQAHDLTLRALVEEGLRLALQRHELQERKPFNLLTFGTGGVTDEVKQKGWRWVIANANERDGLP